MFECDGCKALTCSYSCKKQHEYKHEVVESASRLTIVEPAKESPEERYERLALVFDWKYAFNLRYIDHFFQLNALR